MSKDRDRRNKTLLLVAMSAAKAREISVPTIAISVNIMRPETMRRTRLVRAVAVDVLLQGVTWDDGRAHRRLAELLDKHTC